MKDKKDVIALAVGNTYDIVTRTSMTAHPARAPYPRASFSLLIPIQKGGYMEEIYDVLSKEWTESDKINLYICAKPRLFKVVDRRRVV